MKLHPFDECVAQAATYMERGATVHQQFNCARCGTKQTMDMPNKFYTSGVCEECGHETDIRKNGCNYSVMLAI